MKVYLSPSQQIHNKGVGSYGTEAKRCQDIADRAAGLLRAAGVTVKVTPREWERYQGNDWLAKVVAASNAFGANVHVAIHTNAGPSSAAGCDAWHFPGSTRGRQLTQAIYRRVARIVPGGGRGIRTQPVFYETRAARAPVCYIELGFHTNRADAAHIAKNPDLYAKAIADGVCEYLGVRAMPQARLASGELQPVSGKAVRVPVPDAPTAKKPTWWGPMMKWVKKNR